jgi:hypothetical protein
MLRRDSSFRMAKDSKLMMSSIADKARRDEFRKLMISAQIEGSRIIASKKDKSKDTSDES